MNEMDEPRACYIERSKSARENQILHINICILIEDSLHCAAETSRYKATIGVKQLYSREIKNSNKKKQ